MIALKDIAVGDVVRLSCGSCKMSVEGLGVEDGEDVAHVLYFAPQGVERDTIPLKHLSWPKTQTAEDTK